MMQYPVGNHAPLDWNEEAIIALGRDAFVAEAEALRRVGEGLDGEFVDALKVLYECSGRILVTGLGKSGIIARKVAATLTSTGSPAHFIHPVEAAHGDLGIVQGADVIIAISHSGNNREVVDLLANCQQFGMKSIAITGNSESELARRSGIVLLTPIEREACPLNLTPTTSTTVALAMGDALAVSLVRLRGFRREDFALFHPSGTLGRSLLTTVASLMHSGDELPVVADNLTLGDCLPEIVGKRLGCCCIVDSDGRLAGLCVDGDIKRVLLESRDALELPIRQVMNASPTTVAPDELALSALRKMEQRPEGPITLLIVADPDNKPVGLLHIHDILRAGLL
jgi:arabinose-5-phosphate isomerase